MSHKYPTSLIVPAMEENEMLLHLSTDPSSVLSARERKDLEDLAKDINVYDLGTRSNMYSVFLHGAPHRRASTLTGFNMPGEGMGYRQLCSRLIYTLLRMAWPLTAPPNHSVGRRHEYDRDKLEELRELVYRLQVDRALAEADDSLWVDV